MLPDDSRENREASAGAADAGVGATKPGDAAPRIVLFAAALLIIFGVGALIRMIYGVGFWQLNLGLELLCLPLGVGLLKRRESSRKWTVRLSAVHLILFGAIAWFAYSSGRLNGLRQDEWVLHVAAVLMQMSVSLLLILALRATGVRAWFAPSGLDAGISAAWITPLIGVSTLLAAVDIARDYRAEAASAHLVQSLEDIYRVDLTFDFRDATTGKPVKQIGYGSGMSVLGKRNPDPLRPRVSYGVSSGPEGITIHVTGFAGRPFNLEFNSEGYETFTYTVAPGAPKEVTIGLRPTPGGGAVEAPANKP